MFQGAKFFIFLITTLHFSLSADVSCPGGECPEGQDQMLLTSKVTPEGQEQIVNQLYDTWSQEVFRDAIPGALEGSPESEPGYLNFLSCDDPGPFSYDGEESPENFSGLNLCFDPMDIITANGVTPEGIIQTTPTCIEDVPRVFCRAGVPRCHEPVFNIMKTTISCQRNSNNEFVPTCSSRNETPVCNAKKITLFDSSFKCSDMFKSHMRTGNDITETYSHRNWDLSTEDRERDIFHPWTTTHMFQSIMSFAREREGAQLNFNCPNNLQAAPCQIQNACKHICSQENIRHFMDSLNRSRRWYSRADVGKIHDWIEKICTTLPNHQRVGIEMIGSFPGQMVERASGGLVDSLTGVQRSWLSRRGSDATSFLLGMPDRSRDVFQLAYDPIETTASALGIGENEPFDTWNHTTFQLTTSQNKPPKAKILGMDFEYKHDLSENEDFQELVTLAEILEEEEEGGEESPPRIRGKEETVEQSAKGGICLSGNFQLKNLYFNLEELSRNSATIGNMNFQNLKMSLKISKEKPLCIPLEGGDGEDPPRINRKLIGPALQKFITEYLKTPEGVTNPNDPIIEVDAEEPTNQITREGLEHFIMPLLNRTLNQESSANNPILASIQNLFTGPIFESAIDQAVKPYEDQFLQTIFSSRNFPVEVPVPTYEQTLEIIYEYESLSEEQKSICTNPAEVRRLRPQYCPDLSFETVAGNIVDATVTVNAGLSETTGSISLDDAFCTEEDLDLQLKNAESNCVEGGRGTPHFIGAMDAEILDWLIQDYIKNKMKDICFHPQADRWDEAREALEDNSSETQMLMALTSNATTDPGSCNQSSGDIRCVPEITPGIDRILSISDEEVSGEKRIQIELNHVRLRCESNKQSWREGYEPSPGEVCSRRTCSTDNDVFYTNLNPKGDVVINSNGQLLFNTERLLSESAITSLDRMPINFLQEMGSFIQVFQNNLESNDQSTGIPIGSPRFWEMVDITGQNIQFDETTQSFTFCGWVTSEGTSALANQSVRLSRPQDSSQDGDNNE